MGRQRTKGGSRIRPSGQTTLPSFLFKSRTADEVEKPRKSPEVEPQKREIIKISKKSIKEKARAFSSVRSPGRESRSEGSTAAALDDAVFKRFSSRVREEDVGVRNKRSDVQAEISQVSGRCQDSGKRKCPSGRSSANGDENIGKHVVVLGDDPRPRPKRRQVQVMDSASNKHLYNHYASGSGWWDGDMEGIDGEEVGSSNGVWEGVGSITLGGLEWH